MIDAFLIYRRLQGDSYVPLSSKLEGDSYVPHLIICRRLDVPRFSRLEVDSYDVEDLRVKATFLICRRLEGDSYVPHLSKAYGSYGPHLSKSRRPHLSKT